MSFRTACTKGLAWAVIPALAGLVMAGAGAAVPSAQAAVTKRAHPAAFGLRQKARISLGTTSHFFDSVFTEAPNGNVFFTKGGSTIYVESGGSVRASLIPSSRVLGLAANASDLFVLTGHTVTEYTRSHGSYVRHWSLAKPVHPTIGGLFAVGSTVWAWIAAEPDGAGFQPGRLYRISSSSSAVHVADRNVNLTGMAADATGIYYQNLSGGTDHLAHVTPSGTRTVVSIGSSIESAALWGGTLNLLTVHEPSGNWYVEDYNPSTLGSLSSPARVSNSDTSVAGTNLGLLVLKQVCGHSTCTSTSVSLLSDSGSVSGTLKLPHAEDLLAGPYGDVIENSGGHLYLVKLKLGF
jgi:hypothetical protein